MNLQTDCLEFINPATGEKFGEVRAATAEDVALARRELAELAPVWAARPLPERIRAIKKLQGVIVDAADEMSAVVNQDHGKSRLDALHEVYMTTEKVHQYARLAPTWLADERIPRGLNLLKSYHTERVPFGVVAIIGPWNYPIDLLIPPIVAAMLAGNVVMVKPSEVAAATGAFIESLFMRVPELAPFVRFLHGDGKIGAAVVNSKPDLLFLTGSVNTGKMVARMAAENMTPFLYELGGKDPMLVLEDADLRAAAKWGVWGAFYTSGQACISVERVYVHEAVYDEFVRLAVEEAQKFTVGYSPEKDNTYWMGPLTFERQCDIVNTHLADALDKGARILVGGTQKGMFIEPVVMVDVDHSMKIMQDETFGPVMPIMKVRDDAEAIRLANDSTMGLSAYVWSRDLGHAQQVAKQLQTGTVNINDTMSHYTTPLLPFGGMKLSGNARTHGRAEVTQFTHTKGYSVSAPPHPFDPSIWIRYPGQYRLMKAFLGGLYGTTTEQRLEPVMDYLQNDPQAQKAVRRTAVGVGALAAVGLAASLLLRGRK